MAELFNKKYVYFMWEDELEGKEGFFGDGIEDLKVDVNNNSCKAKTSESMCSNTPFHDDKSGSDWVFFYYDPDRKSTRLNSSHL